ncbi:unnamed protein product [Effrenium voratum]|uniref:Phenylalanyl-tRNA synthetase domain-containing protein n=1 Tax=Effrenium voratum TaxID=2562239 RepID=A0AA36JHF5_9DINO|nr:unnamed protein product [Effrenium voratum]
MALAFAATPALRAPTAVSHRAGEARRARGQDLAMKAMTGGLALAALRRFRPSRGYRLAGANPNAQRPLGLHRAAAVLAKPKELLGVEADEKYNVPVGVAEKLGKNLLLNESHPLGILWTTVQEHFAEQDPDCKFFDQEKPVVNTVDCFDKLRVPPDHVSRSPSDTYYVNADYVLRTHTSAHQCQFLSQYPKITSFLCAGDVYRRDEIDASHYPAFHQCEGVRLFDATKVSRDEVMEDLKKTLEGLAAHLFQLKTGEDTMRWLDEYFPFTEPSLELEIFYNDDWMEVLGCGARGSQTSATGSPDLPPIFFIFFSTFQDL